jgi:ParB family chromosome partitioning protein
MANLDELKRYDANGQLEVRVDAIRQSKVALRDVNRQKPEYLQLAESVVQKGVYTPIQVRVIQDPETGDPAFGLIDGLQRWTASKDAGKEWIPATIKSMDEADILDAQLISNLHRVSTTPQQYTEHLLRILAANPLMTERDLAKRLSVSDTFVQQRLSLAKLTEKAMKLVNENLIPLLNGYSLAKLPPEEQEEFLDRAQTDQPTQFAPAVAARVKELRDAKAQGREAKPSEFVLTPHLQKVKEVFDEAKSPKVGPVLLAKTGITDVVAAWQLALAWATKTDADSEAAARASYEAKKQKREEEKERAKKEREAKKTNEAAERAYA